MSIRSLTINQLIALHAVLSTKNVSLAARQCAISQAGMSFTLKKLRLVFNDELLLKANNLCQLTDFAVALLPKVTDILNQVHNLSGKESVFNPNTCRRHFILSIPGFYEHLLLDPLLCHTSEINPFMNFEFKQRGMTPALDDVLSKKSDLAILLCPNTKTVPDTISLTLLKKERLYFCVNRNTVSQQAPCLKTLYYKGKHVILRNHTTGNRGILDESILASGSQREIIGIASSMYAALIAQQKNPSLIISAPESILSTLQPFFSFAMYPVPIETNLWSLFAAVPCSTQSESSLNWLQQQLKSILVSEPVPLSP